MRLLAFLAAAGAVLSTVNGQTIADLIKANPNMTEIAKLIPANPAWSQPGPNKTLFAPTDAAVRAAYPGGIATAPAPQLINPTTYKRYDVVSDTAGTISAVYDNYQEPPAVEVHLRTGTNEAIGRAGDVTSNAGGVLVGLDGILNPNLSPVATANTTTQTTISLWAMTVQQAGIATYVNSLKESTFYVPTNAAITEVASTLATLSQNQIAAILLYHIIPQRVNSVDLPSDNNVTTVLGAPYSIRLRYGGEGTSTINDATLGIPGDIETTGGPIQIINKVLLPNGGVPPTAIQLPAGVFAAASTTAAASSSATSAASRTAAATTGAASATTASAASSTSPAAAKPGAASRVIAGSSLLGLIAAAALAL
ncbi:Fasciclin-domain-containing protein [Gonapodya prolifera JEL478]|uniref:Fasciclin-domain-containing protein n=1 Tax=Gonapodya prolifera (strain JEL478) TaxID=1344416 RepID=A0A139AX31_GONPJ|nr:Fasciclin-domain-containing protein [Gonapodya prolifera JEL478]|eukprot:KXS21133.1 Fasciclin-domain-containing protein [Gonapodya prolifera JEL478]